MIASAAVLALGWYGLALRPAGRLWPGLVFLAMIVCCLALALRPAVSLAAGWGGLIVAVSLVVLRRPAQHDWPARLICYALLAAAVAMLGAASEAALRILDAGLSVWLLALPGACWALAGAALARALAQPSTPWEFAGLYGAAVAGLPLASLPVGDQTQVTAILTAGVCLTVVRTRVVWRVVFGLLALVTAGVALGGGRQVDGS
jgi:hypothetical protein